MKISVHLADLYKAGIVSFYHHNNMITAIDSIRPTTTVDKNFFIDCYIADVHLLNQQLPDTYTVRPGYFAFYDHWYNLSQDLLYGNLEKAYNLLGEILSNFKRFAIEPSTVPTNWFANAIDHAVKAKHNHFLDVFAVALVIKMTEWIGANGEQYLPEVVLFGLSAEKAIELSKATIYLPMVYALEKYAYIHEKRKHTCAECGADLREGDHYMSCHPYIEG